jgi:hypothetical protein
MKKKNYKLKFPKNKFKCKCDLKENFSNNKKNLKEERKSIEKNLNKLNNHNHSLNNKLIFINFI